MDGHGCKGNEGMKNHNRRNVETVAVPVDERHNWAVSRSNCYGLLALVFRDTPTPKVLEQLRSPLLTEALGRLGYDAAEDLAGDLEAVTERLSEEFTRTFVGPGAIVSLYASVNYEDEGQLWGDSTVWVKRFIETTGLSFKDNWGSIPDHIAIELELMQRLTAHEAQLWTSRNSGVSRNKKDIDGQLCQCLEVQQRFLGEHLCKWAPRFCERIIKTCTSLFYREMANLTKSILASDIEETATAQRILSCG
jgi:TorA maturation chaperone TorD